MVHDLVMIPIAWFAAYLLRFNLSPVPAIYLKQALTVLPLVMVIQGAAFWYFGLYRGVWRFASVPDLIRILKAIVTGVLVSAAVVFLLSPMAAYVSGASLRVDGGLHNSIGGFYHVPEHDRSPRWEGFHLSEPPKVLRDAE